VQPYIIVLNGASSAGKTTIANALVDMVSQPCVITGLDELLERVQPFGPAPTTHWQSFQRAWRIWRFHRQDGRYHLFQRLHREAVAAWQTGQTVLVETSLMDQRALCDAAQLFAPVGGYFIGIKPPLIVSEQWERQRGNRPIGQARKHYDSIHQHNTYDLVIDPSTHLPQSAAARILIRCQAGAPTAFRRLSE
jgi:chloramphenicol 3-O phosphotransferase